MEEDEDGATTIEWDLTKGADDDSEEESDQPTLF
jgi:hypothetical protein